MNKVTLTGRPIKEIILKKTESGKSVCSFILAVDRFNKDAGADFISIVAWEKTADVISGYVKVGDKILINGHISTRTYDDKDGKKVYVTEVVAENMEFMTKKKVDEPKETVDAEYSEKDPEFDTGPLIDISLDSLPF